MSPDQRVALLLFGVPIIAGWVLTEITHALGWGCKR